MKIVYATDNYWPRFSGMAVSIDSFKKELEGSGHEVHVFAPDYPGAREKDKEMSNRNVHRMRAGRVFFSKEDRLVKRSERKRAYREMALIDPDIIHVQTEFTMGRIARDRALEKGIPLVMTCHTYFEQYIGHYLPWFPSPIARWIARRATRSFYERADRVLTPSALMKDVLVSYGVEHEIEVIPTGIPEEDFTGLDRIEEKRSSMLFRRFPALKGKKLLLFVGRIGGEKNVMFLLPVLRKLKKRVRDVHLFMVGDGPQREKMEIEAERSGLGEYITFAGYIDRSEVKYAYTLADVFVFPSKTETQGLVTAEAMICGTPVVAIGVMGTKYVMGGDNGGFMVREDVDEFGSRVESLLIDPQLYQLKSEEALEHAREWTMKRMGQRMSDVYSGLLMEKKRDKARQGA